MSIQEEFIVRHQNGTDHVCDDLASPVFDKGKIIGGMVIFLDMTERKRIEKDRATSIFEKKHRHFHLQEGCFFWKLPNFFSIL